MIHRIRNPLVLAALLDSNAPKDLVGTKATPAEWLAIDDNIALRINDDLAMFEWIAPHVYAGHVWFASKGAQALDHGRQIIAAMFGRYGATSIGGETPVGNRAAVIFARQLGFRRVGEANREKLGRVVLSVLNGNVSQPSSMA